MPPKKPKGGKKKVAIVEEVNKDALSEVDKTFYELQIADISRKLARLKSHNEELAEKNDELTMNYKKLDEDRGDVITYLKKTLNSKTDDATELQERVKGLEERRTIETKEFHTKVSELQKDFSVMKEQLTSEVKMLTGKLNSLEEFRTLRDQLMEKFEKQEKEYEEQNETYKKTLYETEKKFIIGKDNLKKEMEARLIKLAQDFQDATEMRIASSTHRVVRENVALNNELKSVLAEQEKLAEQNASLKAKERSARLALQLAEGQRDTAMEKSIVQVKLIERLTTEHGTMKQKNTAIKKQEFDFDTQKQKIETLTQEIEKMSLKIRILEQNLHASLCEKNEFILEAQSAKIEAEKFKKIVRDSGFAVRAAVKLSDVGFDKADEADMEAARRDLSRRLLELLSVPPSERASSLTTVPSASAAYRRGDLGFIPKKPPPPRKLPSVTYPQSEVDDEPVEVANTTPASSLMICPSVKTICSKVIIPKIGSSDSIQRISIDEDIMMKQESGSITSIREESTAIKVSAAEKEIGDGEEEEENEEGSYVQSEEKTESETTFQASQASEEK